MSRLVQDLSNDLNEAFPRLVLAHQDKLISGVRPMVGAADAPDIVQETLVRAHRALGKYERHQIEELRLSGWLWTIALNVTRNWARDRSRRPRQSQLVLDYPENQSDQLADIVLAEWRERLAVLSNAQREAIVLRHVVDLTYQDMAAATGRPVGTLKTDVSRGLAALRKLLTKEDHHDQPNLR